MKTHDMGRMIRKRRLSLRIDQRALSEISGIAVHTLSNIEAGKSNPTVTTINKVLDALGLDIEIKVKERA
jgi:transcriptional regulator with XRE-family HTH domain